MELQVFSNAEFGSVRSVVINDEPWFVGKDVAEILGYSDAFGALKKHVDYEDKQNCQNDSFESPRGMTIINESGLYSLILSSKMPNAKKFKRWVTTEVLPAIRKHGVFAVDSMLNDPDALTAALQAYKDSQSDADMALVAMLAFWCGNVEEQIDRIFRESGLMREKWDRNTGDSTYGQITIRNAVSSNSTIYTPIRDASTSAEDEFKDLDDPEDSENKSPFRPALSFVTVKLEDMKPHTNPRYQRDEIGIGNAFADYFKSIARFAGDRNIWYVYDGVVWHPDENALAVAELAKVLADRLYSFALQIKDEDTRNRYLPL